MGKGKSLYKGWKIIITSGIKIVVLKMLIRNKKILIKIETL